MREPMTADAARTFGRKSTYSEVTLLQAAHERGCKCQPYQDWFTYDRWQAQGYQVQRGQHGVKLAIIREDTDEETGKVTRHPHHTTVFCRCQVKPLQ